VLVEVVDGVEYVLDLAWAGFDDDGLFEGPVFTVDAE
jgi:hypothetical protein